MKLKDVVALLDKVLPEELIEEGDNSGLLIGDLENDIQHIRTALEATDDVVDTAIEDGVDLLIVHHPLLYRPLDRITSDHFIGHKVLKLIRSGISLVAAHSNLDRAQGGLNQSFGHLIGIHDSSRFDDEGFILIGKLEVSMQLDALAVRLGEALKEPHIRYVGDPEKEVSYVAFCTGSAMNLLTDDLFERADVFLTGDLKYHDAMTLHEKGHALIDIPHFASEVMAAEVLYNLVTSVIDSVEVTIDTSIVNPIRQGGALL